MDTDLATALGTIQRSLGRIEGSQAALQRQDVVHTVRLNDHTKRLGILERWRWYLIGGGATIVGLGSLALRFL